MATGDDFNDTMTRRGVLAAGTAWGLSARAYGRVLGANERVGMAVVGCGGRGRWVASRLQEAGDELRYLCDPDPGQIAKVQATLPAAAPSGKDFRTPLGLKEIDAVLVATPDHWHALPFIHSVQAGKDVYIEKPTAYTVGESKAMLAAHRRTKAIVQIGTQQKSGAHYRQAVELIHGGALGAVSHARFWNVFNNTIKTGGGRDGGIGSPPDGPVPAGVDYDWWLGPAPARAFNANRFHWNYAYFWDYSGGMMSGWGVHHMDIIHWALKARAPKAVAALGGKFALDDNRETPDTLDALFEYPGFTVQGSIHHGNARPIEGRAYGIAFYGSKATLVINREGFELTPEGAKEPTLRVAGREDDALKAHARNFLEAVKSRRTPFADLENGHRASIPCLLANIAFRVGRQLRWDGENETFVDAPDAVKHLSREYRKPWALPG